MEEAVLAYDLGTGGVKASLVSVRGVILRETFRAYETYHRPGGFREQKPSEWWEAVVSATRELMMQVPAGVSLSAVGASGHSMAIAALDSEGQLVSDVTPIWSDTRAVAQAEDFFRRVDYGQWYAATGNGSPRMLYSVFKIRYVMDHWPEDYRRTAVYLGTKDYINYRLCGARVTDVSYATGSGLWDLRRGEYRQDYIQAAGIDPDKLAPAVPSQTVIGQVSSRAAEVLGIPAGIPVVAGGVDNGCMALGAGCVEEGDSYVSLGTSGWMAVVGREPVVDPVVKPYIFGHCVEGLCVSHTGIFSCGSSHRWILDELFGWTDGDRYRRFEELAATSPVGAKGLLFCDALAGGSSNDPVPSLRGGFVGLDLSHNRADVARSVLEGIALHMEYVSRVLLKDSGDRPVLLTGGGAKGAFWRQIFADVFDRDMAVSPWAQGTATMGAAAVTLVGCGLWQDMRQIKALTGGELTASVTHPDPEAAALYRPVKERFDTMLAGMAKLS